MAVARKIEKQVPLKHFYLKKLTAAHIKAELVYGDTEPMLKTVYFSLCSLHMRSIIKKITTQSSIKVIECPDKSRDLNIVADIWSMISQCLW